MSATGSNQQPDLVLLLLRRWRTFLIFAAIGGAGGLAYSLIAPSWYQAGLTVVPSEKRSDPGASLAAKLPSLSSTLGSALAADAQRIQAVLTSNSVTDAIIEKFDLKSHYGKEHIEHAREALWKHCSTSVDGKSSVVTLACEDKDPKRAMEMAAFFGEEGNRVFGRVSASSAREERKFLEKQVENSRHDVDEASRKLREFQIRHKIIDLPEQSKAVISAMAAIKGDLMSKQLQLSYLRNFSSPGESSVRQLQEQIGIMEEQLAELEQSRPQPDSSTSPPPAKAAQKNADFFPDAMSVPELKFELEELYREQKIQETLFFLMTQRYEMAKVDEARDTSTFQILDHPTLPTFPVRPRRMRAAILGLVGGLALGMIFLLAPVWWRQRVATTT